MCTPMNSQYFLSVHSVVPHVGAGVEPLVRSICMAVSSLLAPHEAGCKCKARYTSPSQPENMAGVGLHHASSPLIVSYVSLCRKYNVLEGRAPGDVCVCVFILVWLCVCVCVHACVCVYECVCVCMVVCVWLYMCVCVHVCRHLIMYRRLTPLLSSSMLLPNTYFSFSLLRPKRFFAERVVFYFVWFRVT